MAPNKPEESAENVIGQPIIDYSHFINDFSKLREPSVIRELNKLYCLKNSGVISLAGGLPNPKSFPFEEISVRLVDGTNICLKGKALQDALQYIPSQGYPPLLEKLKQLQWKVHRPPCWENTQVLVTPGSQDGLCKSIEMSLEEGEPIIVQHPVYSGTKCLLQPFRANIIAIEQDENGMRPDLLIQALEERLKPEDAFTMKKGIPKLMYINTTGANPTGVALSTERKKEIYRIACKYNLIILEDDPYYYLHFQDWPGSFVCLKENNRFFFYEHKKFPEYMKSCQRLGVTNRVLYYNGSSKSYPVSFLSLDTEGRVLRFDSFSKIMSPGLRLGFLTGPKQLVQRIELHIQASSLHATSLSQIIIDNVIDKWDVDGLFKHFEFIQKYYKHKRDVMIAAAQKHLTGLAEWNNPTAGMFLWIKVLGIPDAYNLVTKECIKQGVMFVLGHAYIVGKDAPCPYLRACYSLASEEEIEIGMKRLASAIRREQELYNKVKNSTLEKPQDDFEA